MDSYCMQNGVPRGGRRGRGGRGRGRGRGRWAEQANDIGGDCNAVASPDVKEELNESPFETRKVYVGNLKRKVTDKDLWDKLAVYVKVQEAFTVKDRVTKKSKCFGFVTVNTPEEVEVLLNLRGKDLHLDGHPMRISQARKKVVRPGDAGYVRLPLSDRDFDLSPVNPDEPSIHVLVNDVLLRILGYLELRNMVRCERVCRRWQELVHEMFSKGTLELSSESLGLKVPLTRSKVSKLLILHGPHLKELKVKTIDYSTKDHILKMISQLCPNLESLDMTLVQGINFNHLKDLSRSCSNLKSFKAMKCRDFDERALGTLLDSFRKLEVLSISSCPVYEMSFDILPETLKELKISQCPTTVQDGEKIGLRCPNLEVLHMGDVNVPNDVVYVIGSTCPKLIDLSIMLKNLEKALDELPNLRNLKNLTINVAMVDLEKLIHHLPCLQKFAVHAFGISGEADFSILKDLQTLRLGGDGLSAQSIATIAKCPQLEELFLEIVSEDTTHNDILRIIRGCSNIKNLQCPDLSLTLKFISTVNEIMARRTCKVKIGMRTDTLTPKELLEAQYDNKKIEFDPICFALGFFDSERCDSDSDDSYYDFEEEGWLYDYDTYDSDESFSEALLYGAGFVDLYSALNNSSL